MPVHARRNGLYVVEQTVAPRDIAEQLRRVRRDLTLQSAVDQTWQTRVWRVFTDATKPYPMWLFDWRENVEDPASMPLPLSSALVDEAASRMLGSRRVFPDPIAEHDRMLEEQDRREDEETLERTREASRRRGRLNCFHRSVALARARARARNKGGQA